MFFKFIIDDKNQNLCFYLSNVESQQYWSGEQICLELKVWMSNFLNVASSRPEISCKRGVLKNFTKFIGEYLCGSLYFIKISG